MKMAFKPLYLEETLFMEKSNLDYYPLPDSVMVFDAQARNEFVSVYEEEKKRYLE